VCDCLEISVPVLVILKWKLSSLFLYGHLRVGVLRTNPGIQYADLSSLTLHVVQSEHRRSVKEVLYPMPSNSNQIFIYSLLDTNKRTTGTHNSVGMATCPAGSDDRVDASVEHGLTTGQAPKRINRRDEEPHGENGEDHHKD
jgi:hypothetical protein